MVVPKVSRGLRVLPLPTPDKSDVKAERDALLQEIAQIETWWREPRWDDTKRAYTGEPVGQRLCFRDIDCKLTIE